MIIFPPIGKLQQKRFPQQYYFKSLYVWNLMVTSLFSDFQSAEILNHVGKIMTYYCQNFTSPGSFKP